MNLRVNILALFVFFSLNINGQTYINKSYTSNYSSRCGIVRDTQIFFYKDSTFFCLFPYNYTYGHYSLNKDTIKLTSEINERDIEIVNIFTFRFKGKEIYDRFGEFHKKKAINITNTLFVKKQDLLFLIKSNNYKFPSILIAHKPSKKIKLNVNFNIPKQKKTFCKKTKIDTTDDFILKQVYKNKNIINKTIDASKPFFVFDIDSSSIILSPKNMFFYFSSDTLCLSDINSAVLTSLTFKFKKTPLQYYVHGGNSGYEEAKIQVVYASCPLLDKLLTKKFIRSTHKKCTRLLMKSDYFKRKKISYSDNLIIECNENNFNFNGLLFGMGYLYLHEILADYDISENYIISKNNAEYFVSKPAFTKNRLLALIKIKDITEKEEKYLLFERRRRKYALIAEISKNKITKINKSMIYFGQYYKNEW